jgi:ArsR family transcriptional regulator
MRTCDSVTPTGDSPVANKVLDFALLIAYRRYTMNKKTDCCDLGTVVQGKLKPASDATLATLAKALGHPARVKILRFLASKQSCICGDIVDQIGLAQSTVSQHLKVLKDAGLIQGTIDPPTVCYCINPSTIQQLKSLVECL